MMKKVRRTIPFHRRITCNDIGPEHAHAGGQKVHFCGRRRDHDGNHRCAIKNCQEEW